MGSLGSIYVDLSANTAKFTEGLSKAAYTAQQTAKSISREFASLQKVASQTFSPFASLSPVVSQLSFAVSSMGRAALEASKGFGSLKTASGAIGSLAAGATAGFGSMAIGAIAVATRAAESAAKLHELSQSTGVSTEALSGLGFVARQTGVDSEVMTKGLERMSKSAFAAATAQAGTANAYTRLGITVKDSAGQMLSTQTIFTEIANRFAQMADGPAKTALAMQVFGRSGAELIPILNKGGSAIGELLGQAQKLGVVISGETAESAEKFNNTLDLLSESAAGVGNALMEQLLRPLQAVAGAFANVAEKGAEASGPIAAVTGAFKLFLEVGEDVFFELQLLTSWATKTAVAWEVFGEGVAAASVKMAHMDFSGAVASWKDTFAQMDAIQADYFARGKENFQAYKNFFTTLSGNPPSGPVAKKTNSFQPAMGTGHGTPVDSTEKDTVADMIAKLSAEAEAQNALASATDRTTGAMVLQKAAAEAAEKISETRMQLLDEETRLEAQLKNAKAEGRAPEAAGLEKQIAAVKKYLAELQTDTPLIGRLFASIASGKFAEGPDDDVQKFIDKTQESVANAQRTAAAYAQGPQAVAGAEEQEKIAPFQKQLAELGKLRDAGTITANEYKVLADQINVAMASIHESSLAEALPATAKLTSDTNLQIAALNRLTAAAFGSAAALRGAQTENKAQEFANANPFADLAAVRKQYELNDAAQHSSELATRAAQLDASVGYQHEIDQLNEIAVRYRDNKNVVLAAAAEEYDAQRKLVEQWDEMALKGGTFGTQMRTVLNQIALDAENAGAKIAESIGKAVDSLEDQIAKFVVTGKGNFKQIAESFAESSIKTGLQTTAGSIEKALGIKLPGGGHKPTGTSGDPLYVAIVGAGGTASSAVGSTSLIGSLFHNLGKPSTGTTPPFLAGSASLIGSLFNSDSATDDSGNEVSNPNGGNTSSASGSTAKGIISAVGSIFQAIAASQSDSGDSSGSSGGIFGTLGNIFGGFRAGGGDVMPGKAYMVGEDHPELFVPKSAGTIHPQVQMGGGSKQTVVNMHIHGVTNPDDFRRSQSQIYSALHAQMSHANSRNG